MMFGRTLIILLLLSFSSLNSWADLQDSRKELQQIQQRIESAQVDLKQKKHSEIKFSRELALLNRTLKKVDERISGLKHEQREVLKRIDDQKELVASGKQKIKRVGKRLEKRLVVLYKEGEVGPLKILFSADSPTELAQQYHYLSRVAGYDRELLEEYRSEQLAHQQALTDLEQLHQQKAALLKKEEQQRQVAADGRRLQSRLLQQVKQEKKQLNQELAQLKERAERLQGLISRLKREQASIDASSAKSGAGSFGAGKGKLGWPVNGQVLIDFGTQQDKSLGTFYESNGIEIGAAPGTSIRAVADGKVVFSDWFKGYGNLLILSHSGGFHTLYAHAEQLAKKPGDPVAAGDVVGKSGLGGRDSIYFEIRQNGSPVDPLKWLQRR